MFVADSMEGNEPVPGGMVIAGWDILGGATRRTSLQTWEENFPGRGPQVSLAGSRRGELEEGEAGEAG